MITVVGSSVENKLTLSQGIIYELTLDSLKHENVEAVFPKPEQFHTPEGLVSAGVKTIHHRNS